MEIKTRIKTQQSTTPSGFAEGLHRKAWVWYCRGGGFIGFDTLCYRNKNGYARAHPLGRVSGSWGDLRRLTIQTTPTQQSNIIGQWLIVLVLTMGQVQCPKEVNIIINFA